jgi:DNA-binding GntR family transcriptional regulator
VLARDDVYAQLHTWIIDGTLQPGEVLKDHQLADTLGVSRTPVREALRRLEDEGLIETAANRWTRVAPLNVEQARHVYEIVAALEGLALERAVLHLTAEHIDRMAGANQDLDGALERGDMRAAVDADDVFHGVYLAYANNPELTRLLRDLKRKIRRLELAYFHLKDGAHESVQEHNRVLSHLQNGQRWWRIGATVGSASRAT